MTYGGAMFFAKVFRQRVYDCPYCDGFHLTNTHADKIYNKKGRTEQ